MITECGFNQVFALGYGNIACATTAGKVATIIYSMFGIPIMLLILNDLGSLLLVWVKLIASYSSDFFLFLGVRTGVVGLKEGSQQRVRYIYMSRKLANVGLSEQEENGVVEEPAPDPPVLSALCATVAWIMLAAAVFCIWEEWTYFTSIYFFFISCSTIGLGDVTPAHPEYMIATFEWSMLAPFAGIRLHRRGKGKARAHVHGSA
ncbi:Ion channel [Cooperia oncophora]